MSRPAVIDLREAFGLRCIPFTREIRTRWSSPIFDEVLADLHTVISQRMSAALIAPAGSGKTALIRALVEDLPEARYRVHYTKVTSLSKRDFCREIAVAMGIDAVGSYPTLVRKVQQQAEAHSFNEGLQSVLLIDEGHDMRPEVLAILRILTNFAMDSKLVLSIILCGQPPLQDLLNRQELAAVRQRLAHCATLRALSRDECRDYIAHRMTMAGATTLPFDELAMDAIYEISRGNLRAIDHLARKSLELAAKKSVPTVDMALVTQARKKLLS